MDNISTTFSAFADKANLIGAAIVSGVHWPVFALFLALNIVDYIYGLMKARATDTLSSAKGAKGVAKKFSYWVIIALAFGVSVVLIDLGTVIGIDIGFLQLIGWFTLAVYILNELTSIVENMVALGVDVPEILVRGLAAARTAVDEAGDKVVPGDKTDYQ